MNDDEREELFKVDVDEDSLSFAENPIRIELGQMVGHLKANIMMLESANDQRNQEILNEYYANNLKTARMIYGNEGAKGMASTIADLLTKILNDSISKD